MGYDFWGESVAFLGVEITKGSFQAALQRFAAAGNQLPVVGPLPLLEIVARRVAAALEADPFALPGRHRYVQGARDVAVHARDPGGAPWLRPASAAAQTGHG